MNYGDLLEIIIEGCYNTDCQHCNLYNLCAKYDTSPLKIIAYLSECEKEL